MRVGNILLKKGIGNYNNFLDDGESFDYKEGKFNKYEFNFELGEALNIEMKEKIGYEKVYKEIEIIVHNFDCSKKVFFNGNEVELIDNKLKIKL